MNKKLPSSNCRFCNQLLTRRDSVYCNQKCQVDYEWSKRKIRIEEGEILAGHHMKRYIEESRGYFCEECGNEGEWNGKPLTLHMDHINGNSDDNTLGNLRLLCPNCHTQSPTWCGRNKKNAQRNTYARIWRKRVKEQIAL